MSFIYVPFSYLMKGCLAISGDSYLIALFFFALVMQIVLIPLAIKQQKSQIMMAKVKPMEMAIREKYKGRNDRATQQKMTMEIQEMYQKNGYNQFSGCLPLLIQLPIILILFTIVRNPLTYASDIQINIQKESETAVSFYQTQKEMLNKEAFASETEYLEQIKLIESYQTALGGKKQDEQNNGFNVFVYSSDVAVSENEMALSRLIIDGREDLEELVAENKISSEIIVKYEETKLEEYRDNLPNYRVGPLNLINEPDFGANMWLMVIPVLVFLTSFFSTKITRKFSGSAQQTDANGNPVGGGFFMEVGMPLISAIFAYSMPAAIGAYWVWRTILSVGQTLVFAKAMPIPAVTEEMIAEARKEMKSKQKKKKVITIEVDEDDNSYDDIIVGNKGESASSSSSDPTTRTPRRIEMLTSDDDEDKK